MTTKTRGDFIHEWLVEWTSRHASTNATTGGMDEFVACRFDTTTLETLRDTLRCCADAAQTACEESRR